MTAADMQYDTGAQPLKGNAMPDCVLTASCPALDSLFPARKEYNSNRLFLLGAVALPLDLWRAN